MRVYMASIRKLYAEIRLNKSNQIHTIRVNPINPLK